MGIDTGCAGNVNVKVCSLVQAEKNIISVYFVFDSFESYSSQPCCFLYYKQSLMKTKKKKKSCVFGCLFFFLLVSLSELCTDNLLQNKLLRQELLKNQLFQQVCQGISLGNPKAAVTANAPESAPTATCQAQLPLGLLCQLPTTPHRALQTALVHLSPQNTHILPCGAGLQSPLRAIGPPCLSSELSQLYPRFCHCILQSSLSP